MKDGTDMERETGADTRQERQPDRADSYAESRQRTIRPRESMTAENARTNREVMERSQPRTSGFTDTTYTWFDMSSYMDRFEEVQAQFIEEPQEAVRQAEALLGEAVERMTVTLHEQIRRIQNDVGDDKDTERLRMAMKNYKNLIHSLGGHRAA